tara:strand:+ start:32665 stop:32931 length:267 start_codon:yes stop_codon:yes gene_type:complete
MSWFRNDGPAAVTYVMGNAPVKQRAIGFGAIGDAVTSPSIASRGKMLVPQVVSNVCFGGRAKHQFYAIAATSGDATLLSGQGEQGQNG